MPIEQIAVKGVVITADTGESVTFDATLDEKHTKTAQIPQHPVEDGFNVGENVYQLPDDLTLTGVYTNTPFAKQDALPLPERRRTLYEILVEFKENAANLFVDTRAELYFDMRIKSISLPVTPQQGQQYIPTVVLQRVRVVSQQLIAVPAEILAEFAQTSGQSPADPGKQGDAVPTDAEKARGSSVLGDLFVPD